jgi:hypothetical protein
MDMVGVSHRCIPVSVEEIIKSLPVERQERIAAKTYQYRNEELRRTYMRDYMRKYRG